MWDVATDAIMSHVALSVYYMFVGHTVSPANTGEPIKMLFGGRLVAARNHVLDGGAHLRHLMTTME